MNIRRIIPFIFILAIVTLIVAFSACDQIGQLLVPAPSQEEIPIGVVLSVTGRFATSFGEFTRRGLELALENISNSQLDDVKIKFIIEDDQSTVEGAVEAYNKLIHQTGVPVILGPATSSASKEAFPIAQENGVVAFSPSSAAPRFECDW